MHKILPTIMLTITALSMLGGSALAATTTTPLASHGSSITINVTCNNNQQLTRHAESGSGSTAVSVNVNCGGGGGTPIPGPPGRDGKDGAPGKNGQNATVIILTTANATTNHFDTKHFSCTSAAPLLPYNCVKK